MPDVAQLMVRVSADTKGAEEGLSKVDKQVKDAGGSGGGGWKSMLTGALSFAGGLGVFSVVTGAIGLVKDHLGELVSAGEDANRMDALLAAGLRSTHDASGETAQSLQDLADKMLSQTGITDDAAKAGEQMLLTYTSIGKDVFPQAEQAAADMATRFNNGVTPSAQQMTQVALQLGKALNDPATGMTALRRVGVTFTKEQQDQIKTLEKSGNVMGAQKIILAELNKEFGGSAAAAGQANGGMAIFGATMDSLKEKVGQAIIPLFTGFLQNVVGPLATAFATVLPVALNKLQGAISSVAPIFQALLGGAQTLGSLFLTGIKPGLDAVGAAFGKLHGPGLDVSGIVKSIGDAVKGAAPTVKELAGHFSDFLASVVVPLLPKLQSLAGFIAGLVKQDVLANLHILGDVFDTVRKVVQQLLPHLQGLFTAIQQNILPAIQTVAPLVLNLAQFIGGLLLKALQFIAPILGFVAGLLIDGIALALNVVGTVVRAVAPVIQKLGSWLGDHLAPIIHNVSEELGKLHAWFNDKVLPILNKVWGFIQANVLPVLQKLASFIVGVLVADLQTMWAFFSNNILPILQKVAGFLANGIGIAFQNFGNGIQTVTGFIGDLFAAIGNLLGKLGNLKDTIGNVLSKIPHLPGLPSFAAGGVMGASGLAVVGEQGPELVALPGGARIYSAAQTQAIAASGQASSFAGGGAQPVHIHVHVGGRDVATAILPDLVTAIQHGTGIRHLAR